LRLTTSIKRYDDDDDVYELELCHRPTSCQRRR